MADDQQEIVISDIVEGVFPESIIPWLEKDPLSPSQPDEVFPVFHVLSARLFVCRGGTRKPFHDFLVAFLICGPLA